MSKTSRVCLTDPVLPPEVGEDPRFFISSIEGVSVIGYDNGDQQFVMPMDLFYQLCVYFEGTAMPEDGVYN